MTFLARVTGRVRGLTAFFSSENRDDEQLAINPRGDLCIVQSLPPKAEMVRMGQSYTIVSTTGQAALTALPTTVGGLSLLNPIGNTPKHLVIDAFGSWEAVVDATQADVSMIFAMVNKIASTQPSAGTAETGFRSHVGSSALPNATALRGATVVNDGWNPHGTYGQMAAAAAGANWKVNEVVADGLYILPPGAAFSVQAVKAAAAAALQQFFFIRFHEISLVVNK